MNNEQPGRNNFDVVSISRAGQDKRANYIQDAYKIERARINQGGEFVKVFADIFLKKEAGHKAFI